MSRFQPTRSLGKEDETEEEEGLFAGWSGQAGAERHEWRCSREEEPGGRSITEKNTNLAYIQIVKYQLFIYIRKMEIWNMEI